MNRTLTGGRDARDTFTPNQESPVSDLRKLDTSALWHPFTQMAEYAKEDPAPPIITSADGNWLIATDGQRYLDANCGYWCLALGCRPTAVEQAVADARLVNIPRLRI